jgi:hypothetical protein
MLLLLLGGAGAGTPEPALDLFRFTVEEGGSPWTVAEGAAVSDAGWTVDEDQG